MSNEAASVVVATVVVALWVFANVASDSSQI
jgi:hypothetical protein